MPEWWLPCFIACFNVVSISLSLFHLFGLKSHDSSDSLFHSRPSRNRMLDRFPSATKLTGVTFKRFHHLGIAWKRILHSWWTSEKKRKDVCVCAWQRCWCCCCDVCFFCVCDCCFSVSSTAWITVLRSDKQALCEVQVFFSLYFFWNSTFALWFVVNCNNNNIKMVDWTRRIK